MLRYLFSHFFFLKRKWLSGSKNPTSAILNEFLTTDYDVASYKPNFYLDIVVTISQYNELISRGFDIQITQTEKQLRENLKETLELDGYKSYNEILNELLEIELMNPGICKLYDIGDSWGKIYSDAGNFQL